MKYKFWYTVMWFFCFYYIGFVCDYFPRKKGIPIVPYRLEILHRCYFKKVIFKNSLKFSIKWLKIM